MTTDKPKTHLGKNLKRFRIFRGVSQEKLAEKLGLEWNQKRISLLEAREEIEEELLKSIATALQVTPEYIKEFDEDIIISNVHNYYDQSNNNQSGPNGVNNFNHAEEDKKRIQELTDRLAAEQQERIKEKSEMIAVMQKLIEKLEGKK